MKFLYLISCIIILGCSSGSKKANNSSEHHIYLVRHAEKADDGTSDPPLNELGARRANKLAEKLKDKDIKKIYSTEYKRTLNTAAPLSAILGIETTIFDPRDTSFYNVLRQESRSMNILVVGHSNSTPMLTNSIIGEEKFEKLDESVYDQLFEINAKDGKFDGSVRKM